MISKNGPNQSAWYVFFSIWGTFLFLFWTISVSFVSSEHASLASKVPGEWVVNPNDFGEDKPPLGRSAFDELFLKTWKGKSYYDIPWPFEAFVEHLDGLLAGPDDGYINTMGVSGIVGVLIPKGRSLQRDAAKETGEYFRYPRVVIAVNAPPKQQRGEATVNLQDRMYVGYQENSNVLEVISYNEAAGRFEFQVVARYDSLNAPNKNFAVSYQNRSLCLQCHQNHTPIFSRRPWGEVAGGPDSGGRYANDDRIRDTIFGAIVGDGSSIKDPHDLPFGVSLRRGEDGENQALYHGVKIKADQIFPNAFDDATDRVNFVTLYNRIWDDGCKFVGDSTRTSWCRGELVKMALWFRLNGDNLELSKNLVSQESLNEIVKNWQRVWPEGLKIPNPNIQSRDPFDRADELSGNIPDLTVTDEDQKNRLKKLLADSDVEIQFEPTVPRDPVAYWNFNKTDIIHDFIGGGLEKDISDENLSVELPYSGLSSYFTNLDIQHLNQALLSAADRAVIELKCDEGIEDGKFIEFWNCTSKNPTKDSLVGLMLVVEDGILKKVSVESASPGEFRLNESDATDLAFNLRAKDIKSTLIEQSGSFLAQLKPVFYKNQVASRLNNGQRVQSIRIEWRSGNAKLAKLKIELISDVNVLAQAIDQMVAKNALSLQRKAFSRRLILKDLYNELSQSLKIDEKLLNTQISVDDVHFGQETVLALNEPTNDPRYSYVKKICQHCHGGAGSGRAPKILVGNNVNENIKSCLPRMYFRLSMYRFSSDPEIRARTKSPMPLRIIGLDKNKEADVIKFINGKDYLETLSFLDSQHRQLLKSPEYKKSLEVATGRALTGDPDQDILGQVYPQPTQMSSNSPLILSPPAPQDYSRLPSCRVH